MVDVEMKFTPWEAGISCIWRSFENNDLSVYQSLEKMDISFYLYSLQWHPTREVILLCVPMPRQAAQIQVILSCLDRGKGNMTVLDCLFADIHSLSHAGCRLGWKNFLKYTKSTVSGRTFKYCTPVFTRTWKLAPNHWMRCPTQWTPLTSSSCFWTVIWQHFLTNQSISPKVLFEEHGQLNRWLDRVLVWTYYRTKEGKAMQKKNALSSFIPGQCQQREFILWCCERQSFAYGLGSTHLPFSWLRMTRWVHPRMQVAAFGDILWASFTAFKYKVLLWKIKCEISPGVVKLQLEQIMKHTLWILLSLVRTKRIWFGGLTPWGDTKGT